MFTRRVRTSVKFDPKVMFSTVELHIILKPRNVKNCEHSIFSILEQKYV